MTEAVRWYVIQVRSGCEKKVSEDLERNIKKEDKSHLFEDIIVPSESVVEMRNGQKRRSERKLFPGYVLVKMTMSEDSWHFVRNLPNVLGFIGGTPDKPAPISQKEADAILQQISEGVDKPKPKTLFEPGELVRIIDGPFKDFTGCVERVNYEKSRLSVGVMILGRVTPVELEFGQVEKTT